MLQYLSGIHRIIKPRDLFITSINTYDQQQAALQLELQALLGQNWQIVERLNCLQIIIGLAAASATAWVLQF